MDYKEKVIAILNSKELSKEQKEKLEYIFPELKESEDEKIRKLLVEAVTQVLQDQYCSNRGVSKEKILAWLEKQGEQKKELLQELDEKLNNALENETSDSLKKFINEQKPAWSEEDSVRLQRIIDFLWKNRKGDTDTIYQQEQDVDWLKNLKDRCISQPKQEWSEEDKRKIDRIYSILMEAADTHAFSTSCRLIGDKECVELQDFLKSLRPQKQWKPSDEQMEALHDAAVYVDKSMFPYPKGILMKLYEQLKKLKS